MSHKRLRAWQKATALVPLALLSGAWTASLAVTNTASAAAEQQATLPDGTTLPDQAITAPASVSIPGEIAPGVSAGSTSQIIAGASANGIPSAALSAYQRAAQVIDSADRSCNIGWQLIGAIGRVESDHGRYGGNVLTTAGKSRPGIYGIPLDGTNGTSRIADTDAGQYDNDPIYDRAIGPMQFIPSTWSVVGVDGDGDGTRDPQDIDDAALATAVYLCSGEEDLATTEGQQAAVYRYNHSQDYVDLVLSIMRAYSQGDYASVPNQSAATTVFSPSYSDAVINRATTGKPPTSSTSSTSPGGSPSGSSLSNGGTAGNGGTPSGSSGPSDGNTPEETPPGTPPAADPGTNENPSKPVSEPVKKTVKDTGDDATKTLISTATAVKLCTAELTSQFGEAPQQAVTACVAQLEDKTLAEAQAAVGNVVANLSDLVGGLIGGVLGGLG